MTYFRITTLSFLLIVSAASFAQIDIYSIGIGKEIEKKVLADTNNKNNLFVSGNIKIYSNSPDEALIIFNSLQDIQNNSSQLYYCKGLAQMLLGSFDTANFNFDKALSTEPFNGNIYIFKALCKLNKHDYHGAISDYNLANTLGGVEQLFPDIREFISNSIKNKISINSIDLFNIIKKGSDVARILLNYYDEKQPYHRTYDISDELFYNINDLKKYCSQSLFRFYQPIGEILPDIITDDRAYKSILSGMNYDLNIVTTIEISLDLEHIIKLLVSSDQKNNPNLIQALQSIEKHKYKDIDQYLKNLLNAYKSKNSSTNIARLFWRSSSYRLKENASDQEVINYLRKEIDYVTDNSLQILKSRLDKCANVLDINSDKSSAKINVIVFDLANIDGLVNFITNAFDLKINSSDKILNEKLNNSLDASHYLGIDIKKIEGSNKYCFFPKFDKNGLRYINYFADQKFKDQNMQWIIDGSVVGNFSFAKIKKEGISTNLNYYKLKEIKLGTETGIVIGLSGHPKIELKGFDENILNGNKNIYTNKEPLVLLKIEDLRRAMLNMDSLIIRNPKNSDYLFTRALIKSDMKMYQAAILDLDNAIKLTPTESQYILYHGLVNFKNMNLEQAQKDFSEFLKLNPKSTTALYLRGITKILVGNHPSGCNDIKLFKGLIGNKILKNSFCD